MSAELSQSWLAQAGRTSARDGLIVTGLMAITTGAVALSLTFIAGPSALAALTFIARVLTAIGGVFLALPPFLGGTGGDRWSGGGRIAGLVGGFFIVLFSPVRVCGAPGSWAPPPPRAPSQRVADRPARD